MSKKLHSKLLSVILVIAICCATLCGSLIAAHAAEQDYIGTYSFEGGVAPYGAKQASINVTFELASGFVNGEFAVLNADGKFKDVSAKIVDGRVKEGTFNANNIDVQFNAEYTDSDDILDYIYFADKNDNLISYTSLTFELTYTLSNILDYTALSADISEVLFTSGAGLDITPEFTGEAGSIHAHKAGFGSIKSVDENDKVANAVYHTVYNSTCSICGSDAKYQLYPDYTTDPNAEYQSNTWVDGSIGLSGVSVSHKDNGNLEISIHGHSLWPDLMKAAYIVITDTNGRVIDKLTTQKESSYAGTLLADSAKMWTYNDMSARDINEELIITMFSIGTKELNDGSKKKIIIYSSSLNFSLTDYCEKVVTDQAVWPDYATEQDIINDKDVAAALCYYGAAIDEKVFDKNTGTSSTINYTKANYDVWDGNKEEPSDINNDGTIDITTAEELAWVVFDAGETSSTTDAKYKIADNSVFNMNGFEGIELNSTADDVKTATATGKYWFEDLVNNYSRNDTNGDGKHDSNDTEITAFQGALDGNGAIIYNINATKGAYSGLIPQATRHNVSISNITVKASAFKAYHMMGGLIGRAYGNGNSATITGCAVEECYFGYDTYNGGFQLASGVFVGYSEHMGVTIDNCRAVNNSFDETNLKYYGGFIGSYSAWGSGFKFSNSISIGSSPFHIVRDGVTLPSRTKDGAEYIKMRDDTTWLNVYSDTATPGSAFDNAKNGIKIGIPSAATLGSAWFDTASYPELSVFHKLTRVYVNESEHKVVCALKVEETDTTCDLKGVTEEHTFDIDEVNKIKKCECGYSEKILGNYVEPQYASSDTWDGSEQTDWTYDEESGCYIISTAEQLYAMITNDGKVDGVAANFKVADDIKAIYLTDIKGTINSGADADAIMSAVKNSSLDWNNLRYNWKDTYCDTEGFVGNFDGNGVTIYGMRVIGDRVSSNATFRGGFIPTIKNDTGSVTIENVSFKYSYVQSQTNNPWFGVVVGSVGYNGDGITGKQLTFDNVRVEDVEFDFGGYDGLSADYAGHRGGLCGLASGTTVAVNNCFVSDISTVKTYTSSTATPTSCAFVSTASAVNINNSVAITDNVGTATTKNDTYIIATANAANAKGVAAKDNMPLLDWDETWFTTTNGYPELHAFHSMITECIDENTHQYVCQHYIDGVQCPVKYAVTGHTLEENNDGTAMECDCGYSEEINGTLLSPTNVNYDVWDGTSCDTSWDYDEESGCYIISSAAELYGMIKNEGKDSSGNAASFKVADNIKVFYLNDIKSLIDSGATDEEILDAVATGANNWNQTYYGYADNNGFVGNFDGNGAIIYGMRTIQPGNKGGFIPSVVNAAGEITIKNVAFKYSYMKTSVNDPKTGVVVGMVGSTGSNDGNKEMGRILTFDNVRVENAEFEFTGTFDGQYNNYGYRAGLCARAHYAALNVNNCFVSDIETVLGAGSTEGSTAYATNGDPVASGFVFQVQDATEVTVTNSIDLTNERANAIQSTNSFNSSNSYSILDGECNKLSSADLAKGAAAKDNMPLLDWNETWFTTTDGYPELHKFHDMKLVTIDNGTHQYVCQHYFVDDDVYCPVSHVAEAHNFKEEDKVATCTDCGYHYEIKGIHDMGLPDSVKAHILANDTFNKNFSSNALFKSAYAADNQSICNAENELDIYTTSLNLKVNPYIAFTFAFNTPYFQNRNNIDITFTVDGETYTTNPPEYVLGEHFSKTPDEQGNGNWTNNKGAGRYHLYRFTALPVSKLCKPIAVSVNYGGTEYAAGTYSAAGFAINAINAGEDYISHANASIALVYYSEMLAKYLAD